MKNEMVTLVEWAVWEHLDSKIDLELILLKGHLLLEVVLNATLSKINNRDYNNYSFHRKIMALEKLDFEDKRRKSSIVSSLKKINKLRNQLAHEFNFDLNKEGFESWSLNVFENLKGEKFTKYTFRTKIVHSFSVLSKNILELSE